ncbi:serine-rich adhesin for platelets-like [Portunus trituberculatus]|uniref:serine-rich adhesin for platelets-like n=1 Tax=Portunus trituberculatus TaxID=210409 RepID=UPI001E1CEE4E|nr:serine-rich adhesin for platelets-like [Portunus trituberculatus]
MIENSEIEKEREMEKKVKKTTQKEKKKSPEITTLKTQQEETTKEEKKEVTKEEGNKKATEVETAEEEEKKTKKRHQPVSTRKKEGMKDERTQGHLYLKKKRKFNPWKEYYFVLDGLLLTYYRSQHDYERLSCMKGSLDMSLVEEVHAKKPGIMRIHHPFCLVRRNLRSIKLAAETKQEQERWMEVLKTAIGPRRLSCYSSDRTLNSGTSPTTYSARSATLPSRVKDVSTYSSSITEEEDDEEKKAKEKEEDEEKEETELIKPKKIPRVPIGMPIFKPNLDQVKLKNVEKKVKSEDAEEGKAANVSSPNSPHASPRQEHLLREALVSGVFGVVLKKAKNKEEEEEEAEKQEEEKESSKEAGSGHDGPASPGHATSSNRRPLKQPVIPLNNKKLLVLPEVKESKSPRVSPATQKRSTVDRRKSPSPSLPISKSVQALTKSAEEVRPTQMDTISSADTTTTMEWKSKDGEVKVCHAYTSEVKYSDEVDLLDMEEVTEKLIKERNKGDDEGVREKDETSENEYKVVNEVRKNETSGNEYTEMNEVEKQKQEEEEGAKTLLDTDVKVVKNEKEDEEENKEMVVATFKEEALNENTFSEEFLDSYNTDSHQVLSKENHKDEDSSTEHKSRAPELCHSDTLPESSSIATLVTPPASPASSMTSTNSEPGPKSALSSTVSSEFLPPESDPFSPKETPPSSGNRRDVEEKVHSTTQENKQMATEKHEEFETVACDGPRDRSNTNESTASSCIEGGEKKPGKFKLLKNKLKGGSTKEKKEESAVQREPKEKKRRGSSTFSSFLQGKKSKESSKKEEELQTSQVEDMNGSQIVSPDEVTPPSESLVPAKALPVIVVPSVDVQVIPPSAPQPYEEEPQDKQDALLSGLGSACDRMVSLRTTVTYSEARSSVHSRTSIGSRDDPPPSIPEKTYMRAPSPNHDVPKNNRPVTNLQLMGAEGECDDEDESNHRVDGIITEQQIEALLHAKENQYKRKRSLSRNQPFAKPDVLKDTSLTSLSSDEWTTKRPSYISCSSIDSDESLLTTNFLSFEQQSSSSSSIKGLNKAEASSSCSLSESGDLHSPDVDGPADPLQRAPRATDGIATKTRISLTSPEFTVEEEDLSSSPETPNVKQTHDINVEEDANKEQHGGSDDESEAEAECKDFFPVVGGDVQLRQSTPLDLPTGNLRTSGIVSLKEYLEAHEEKEDFQDVKSGISRLGHSAAVEKLKQTTNEQ